MSIRALLACTLFLVAACGGSTTAGVDPPSSDGFRLLANADGSPTGDGTKCAFEGHRSNVGEAFKNDCNDCKCTAQGVACTERSCGGTTSSSGAVAMCKDGATLRREGETWTIPAPCVSHTCTCMRSPDGQLSITCGGPLIGCSDASSPPPADICPKGSRYNDGCNECRCDENGTSCTKRACKCPDPGYIDCMPIVPPERAALCSGSYHQWIRQSCPDVKFAY